MAPKKIITLLFCFLCITSCVEELDFSQIEDYNATPVYEGSIAYFTIKPIQFFNQSGAQETERTDVTDFRIFDNSYLRKNLVKMDFHLEIKNEFDRGVTIQIEFLDDNSSPTHIFQEIKVDAKNLDYKFDESIEVSVNPNIKNTTKVKVYLKIDNPTTPLDPNDTSEFEFKSSAKIYIDTDA